MASLSLLLPSCWRPLPRLGSVLRWCALAGLTGSLAACATTRLETGLNPNPAGYAELPVQMERVKSPQTRLAQDGRLAFAVAVSGGGERAANFGAGVLLGLEALRLPGLPAGQALGEVDYFSTVSGGGFTAAAYLSSLHDYLRRGGAPGTYSLLQALSLPRNGDEVCDEAPPYVASQRSDPCLREHLAHDYAKDSAQVLNPFSRVFWRKWLRDLNRTHLLEMSIDDHVLGALWRCQQEPDGCAHRARYSLSLGDLYRPQDAPGPALLPVWVANASTYEDGNIFPFTPGQLMAFRVRGYAHQLERHCFRPGLPLREGDDPCGDQERSTIDPGDASYLQWVLGMPAALGVAASGNFPVALPATTLPSGFDPDNRYLHLLDGGLADNLGVITALRLLEQDRDAARKVLLVVDASRDALGPFSANERPPSAGDAYNRTTTAGLDAWHARYREIVRGVARGAGIGAVFFISFEDLSDAAELERMLALPPDPAGTLTLVRSDLDKLTARLEAQEVCPLRPDLIDPIGAREEQAACLRSRVVLRRTLALPVRLLRNVATSYNVDGEEQKLLIAAGRRAVALQAAEIARALSGAGR
jgi:hypothetical protein